MESAFLSVEHIKTITYEKYLRIIKNFKPSNKDIFCVDFQAL